MSKKTINLIVSYVCALLIGIGMAALVASNYGYKTAVEAVDRYRILCDACTIPGVTLVCVGLLSWVARQGAFDGLTYAVRFLFHWIHREQRHVRYYDYLEEKREKRAEKEKNSFLFLIITGAAFLLAAGVLMILFYQVY